MSAEYVAPAGGFKALASITDFYTKSLQFVYPAARDIAKELEGYASDFAVNAKARIEELVVTAQNLRWEKDKLEREAEAAREGTAEAVQTIHAFLNGNGLEDLRKYQAEEENKAVEPTASKAPDA